MRRQAIPHFIFSSVPSKGPRMASIALAASSLFTFAGAVQTAADAPASALPQLQSAQELTMLEPGKPVENEISGGQVQGYRITLSAGQFVSVIVQQRRFAGLMFSRRCLLRTESW